MNVISKRKLQEFWAKQPKSKQALEAWFAEAKRAQWNSPQDVKNQYAHASFLASNRVVFNVGGNKYRIVAMMLYTVKTMYVRFVGTHAEYDKVDSDKV